MVNVGDRIEIESETVGRATRCGEVIGKDGTRLHVRWDDGHESTFIRRPATSRCSAPAEPSPTRPADRAEGSG